MIMVMMVVVNGGDQLMEVDDSSDSKTFSPNDGCCSSRCRPNYGFDNGSSSNNKGPHSYSIYPTGDTRGIERPGFGSLRSPTVIGSICYWSYMIPLRQQMGCFG